MRTYEVKMTPNFISKFLCFHTERKIESKSFYSLFIIPIIKWITIFKFFKNFSLNNYTSSTYSITLNHSFCPIHLLNVIWSFVIFLFFFRIFLKNKWYNRSVHISKAYRTHNILLMIYNIKNVCRRNNIRINH